VAYEQVTAGKLTFTRNCHNIKCPDCQPGRLCSQHDHLFDGLLPILLNLVDPIDFAASEDPGDQEERQIRLVIFRSVHYWMHSFFGVEEKRDALETIEQEIRHLSEKIDLRNLDTVWKVLDFWASISRITGKDNCLARLHTSGCGGQCQAKQRNETDPECVYCGVHMEESRRKLGRCDGNVPRKEFAAMLSHNGIFIKKEEASLDDLMKSWGVLQKQHSPDCWDQWDTLVRLELYKKWCPNSLPISRKALFLLCGDLTSKIRPTETDFLNFRPVEKAHLTLKIRPTETDDRPVAKAQNITKKRLRLCGRTPNCPGCAYDGGQKGPGHTEECYERISERMKEPAASGSQAPRKRQNFDWGCEYNRDRKPGAPKKNPTKHVTQWGFYDSLVYFAPDTEAEFHFNQRTREYGKEKMAQTSLMFEKNKKAKLKAKAKLEEEAAEKRAAKEAKANAKGTAKAKAKAKRDRYRASKNGQVDQEDHEVDQEGEVNHEVDQEDNDNPEVNVEADRRLQDQRLGEGMFMDVEDAGEDTFEDDDYGDVLFFTPPRE